MRPTAPITRRAAPGFIVITVIVVLALAMALFGLWARAAITQHRWLDGAALRMQAVRLAESGVARAIERRAADPKYAGETWSIPAADFHNQHAAEVRIRIEPAGDSLLYTATADYPFDAVRRARVTKQIEIPNPASGDES